MLHTWTDTLSSGGISISDCDEPIMNASPPDLTKCENLLKKITTKFKLAERHKSNLINNQDVWRPKPQPFHYMQVGKSLECKILKTQKIFTRKGKVHVTYSSKASH